MINVFGPKDNLGDEWTVWTDISDDEPHSGRCLAAGDTRAEALRAAKKVLRQELVNVAYLQKVKFERSTGEEL